MPWANIEPFYEEGRTLGVGCKVVVYLLCMQVLFLCAGGDVGAEFHQPAGHGPRSAVLRGVQHALVHVRAVSLHRAGRVRRLLRRPLHQEQHRVVSLPQEVRPRQIPHHRGLCRHWLVSHPPTTTTKVSGHLST